MRRDGPVAHVVVAGASSRQVQRWKVAADRKRRVLRRGRGRMSRSSFGIYTFRRTGRSLFILSQACLRLQSSLLNSASVMILMACQSSTARERLLTICVGAFVRSLARMNAAMSGQRGGIAEGLYPGGVSMRRSVIIRKFSIEYSPFHIAHTYVAFRQCEHGHEPSELTVE